MSGTLPKAQECVATSGRRGLIRSFRRLVRLAQFVMVGSTGMVVDLSSMAVFLWLLPYPVARALAIWLAMSWNFALNRALTFADAPRRPILRQYGLFCAACLAGAVVNWSISTALCFTVAYFTQHRLLAAFCGIVAGTGWNYVLSAKIVFPQEERAVAGRSGRDRLMR